MPILDSSSSSLTCAGLGVGPAHVAASATVSAKSSAFVECTLGFSSYGPPHVLGQAELLCTSPSGWHHCYICPQSALGTPLRSALNLASLSDFSSTVSTCAKIGRNQEMVT